MKLFKRSIKEGPKKRNWRFIILGAILCYLLIAAINVGVEYTSSDEYCQSCHVLRHGFDTGAKDLDIEGAGEKGQGNNRPADVGNDRHFEPAVRRISRCKLPQRKIEKQQL